MPQPISPSLAAEIALPFFCQRLRDDLGLKALFGIHLLHTPIFVFQFFHACHEQRVHPAGLGAPLVERSVADAVFAQLEYGAVGFGLLEDSDDLAVGKAKRLYLELSVK